MCGILGEVYWQGGVDPRGFGRMLATLAARGPDGEGTRGLARGRVALGHRRLAINDLSEAAVQPMPNEDGSLWLSFNGEIYNFRELRKELEQQGHAFRSASDSEVILHAYEEWGDDCLERLRGIFAFGLWDERRERLLLARDRLGVKPLYYWAHEGGLVFASQPRAILAHPRFRRRVDLEALSHYLVYRYVPGEQAIWSGMKKLGPAQRLVLDRRGLQCSRWWELRYAPRLRDAAEAAKEVQERLAEAVRMQLVSDVPVGVFLSGGIDSSVTAAVAAEAQGRALPAFTIGFDDAAVDERRYARRAAERLGLVPHEELLTQRAALALLPDFAALHDEPFYDPSSLPTLAVSRLARRHGVPVVLGGDGADELFAGYRWYEVAAPQPFSPRRWLRARLRGAPDPVAAHLARVSPLAGRLPAGLVAGAPDCDPSAWLRRLDAPDAPHVTRLQLLDLRSFLVDDVLLKVDHASMACGVEVRVPILDHELVETAFAIESRLLFAAGERKALWKRAAARWLPDEICSSRKQGFSAPLDTWMRQGLRERAQALVRRGVLVESGLLHAEGVDALLAAGGTAPLWLLFAAELWARHWLEPASPPLRELFPAEDAA
jgi:asparagine synthase (glutamine-hydrolysing)